MISFNSLFSNRKKDGVFQGRSAASARWFFAFLIVIAPLVICAAAGAVEVNYIGDGSELENTPNWFSDGDDQSLFAGTTDAPLASGNKVTINYSADNRTVDSYFVVGGTTNPYFVVGGMSEFGEANHNSIILLNGRVAECLYGGWSGSGNVLGNSVVISGGSVYYGVYGGWNNGVGDVTDNDVIISNGFVDGYVYGGWSDTGMAANNVISISGGTAVGVDVYGGWSNDGAAYGNVVTISSSSVSGVVIGGVNIKDSSTNNGVKVSDSGGVASNIVIINGGSSIGGNVTGGLSTANGGARDNTVIISDSLTGASVYGGRASRNDDASNNSVDINNSRVEKDVYGGYSYHNVDNNSVSVSGGSVGGNIYGGYVDGNGDAINNTVTIFGSPVFSAGSYIYGGYVKGTGEDFTGNTLNVKSAVAVKGVDNFEHYNFYLPAGMPAGYTMLAVADDVDLLGATINIYLQGDITLQTGDTITLIESGTGKFTRERDFLSTQASLGTFLTFDFDIHADTHDLWAELTSVKTSSGNKALTNSRTAPLAFLNQGADLAASLEPLEVSGDSRYTTFAVMGGGSSTYDTGSDVDIDSFSMLAGVTWNAPVKRNSLALSVFIEAGWSSYDTTNNILGSKDVKGSGDADYFGGGLHARYKWDSGVPGGLYTEGSFRYGRVSTNFDTNDLQSQPAFHYDSGSKYYGAHAGLGYVWQLSGKTRLDVSGKYLWTRLESDEFTASSGDRISFDSANSSRLRAGFRLYHDYGNAVTLYYGAAYEYEFDGDADGRLYGTYALDRSSLSGGNGIGELGVTFRPSTDNDRLTMQLGLQGYVGVREGISGTLKMQYAF